MLPQKQYDNIDVKRPMLVMLDAILDTRMGTIRTMHPEFADELLTNKNYRLRKSDEMQYVDSRIDAFAFQSRYIKRDIEVFMASRKSLIATYLIQLIKKLQLVIDGNNPLLDGVDVYVNYYPYEFTQEQQLLVSAGITAALGLVKPVIMVSVPVKDITLDFLKERNVFAFVLYDFNEWTCAALPDDKVDKFEHLGLEKIDNLTVIASKIAISEAKALEVEKLVSNINAPWAMDDLTSITWSLLFDLELIDPVFFTEHDESIAEKVMSVIEKSSSPIDIEVGLVAEYYKLLKGLTSPTELMGVLSGELVIVANDLHVKMAAIGTDSYDVNGVRVLLAKQRFLNDAISTFVPSQPATDFERYVDAQMSHFDTSLEASEISEHNWNKIGVACRRITREVPQLSRTAYILVCLDTVVDDNGVTRTKGSILPSHLQFDAMLDDMPLSEVDAFSKEMQK